MKMDEVCDEIIKKGFIIYRGGFFHDRLLSFSEVGIRCPCCGKEELIDFSKYKDIVLADIKPCECKESLTRKESKPK